MPALLTAYRPYFVSAAAFSLVINLLMLLPALYMLQVFDRVLTSRHPETLVLLTVLTLSGLSVMMLLDVLRARVLAAVALAMDKRNAAPLLCRLLDGARRPRARHDVHGLKDLATLRALFTGPAIVALFDAPWLPLYLLLIFIFHPLMGLVASLGAVLLVLLAALNQGLTREPLLAMQLAARRAGHFADMSLRNAEVAAALGMAPAVAARWQQANDEVLALQARSGHWSVRIAAMSKFVRQAVQVSMLGAGAWLVIGADVAPGVMVAATILLGRALAPVESLIASWRVLVEARAAAGRLQALQLEAADATGRTALPTAQGALRAEQLIFAFGPAEPPVLKGVSWALEAGESLAVVGASASGKSTLARLLVGVWQPQRGAVRLEGAELSQWPAHRLGPHIGYLPQDVELFDGTVADNIARMGAAALSESIVAAARAAHTHELILQLPQGYDTLIGDGGVALSGGQRQRIALARALYGEPCLVVLDEPNASLDSEGEEALMRALHGLKSKGVTLVVVSHRPALIASMDKVLVLRDGAVELFAPRDEFLGRLSRLSQLKAAQSVQPAQARPRAA